MDHGVNGVRIIDDTVLRLRGEWTPRVREFLSHLERTGFDAAPRPLPATEEHDVVSFLPGEVGHPPLPAGLRTDRALISAARLLRRFHDAGTGFLPGRLDGWQFPPREPVEVVCHGDLAGYNLVFRAGEAVGIIDFDTAHPGPRWWDVAYAVYSLAPLAPPDAGGWGELAEQARRARLFCDTYRCDTAGLVDRVVARLRDLVALIRWHAAQGHPGFRQHLRDGHDTHYLRHVDRLREHRDELERLVSSGN